MRRLLTALFAILVIAGPASAQDYKPVGFNIGGGWAFPSGDFKSEFDSGYNFTAGLTFNLNPHLGIQGEYIYAKMDGPSRTIPVISGGVGTNGIFESNHQMHVGSFNLVYNAHSSDRPMGGYVLGGFGIYHRIVQITSPSVGFTTICDPDRYVCYPAAVSVDQIIGDRSSNDFGIDFGGGITLGHEAKFYVESRYHYVWGKEFKSAAGNCSGGCGTNASYFPLTFGVRW